MATTSEKDSLTLHATMECLGSSSFVRLLRDIMSKHLSMVMDVALTISKMRGYVKEVKFLGSMGEGMTYFNFFTGSESDSDIMMVSKNSLVYEHNFCEVPVSTWLFEMQPCSTNSGYVRLRLRHQGNVRLYNSLFDVKSLFEYDTVAEGNYLTNAINQQYVKLLQNNVLLPFPNMKARDSRTDVVDSGPCVTCTNSTILSRIGALGDLDLVTGMWCSEWPSVAVEWILRDRTNGWPSRDFVDQQVSRGCYVIPKGCKECTKTHLDWRISFAHIEQDLIRNMNVTQVHCFLLLRQLKKFFFGVQLPNVITSYIIKTTLFWTIEETAPELWQSHKLLKAVKVCLNKLITFIQNDNCPHYFIRTCNLVVRKYSHQEKWRVLQICLEARRNPMKIVSQTPPFTEELRLRRSNPELSSEFSGQDMMIDPEDEVVKKLFTSSFFQSITFSLNALIQIKLSDLESKQEVLHYCRSLTHDITDLFSNSTNTRRQEEELIEKHIQRITQRLICSFEMDKLSPDLAQTLYAPSRDTEDVNGIANLCHLHIIAGNYSACNDILVKFIKSQKFGVYKRYVEIGTMTNGNELLFTYGMINTLLAITDDSKSCISDMVFLQMEDDTLPLPLQMELNPIPIGKPEVDILPGSRPTVLVDPLVYLCFLKFWCSMKLDQNIGKLMARDDMVWCCSLVNITEKAVALNLLAFCHVQLGEYEQAFAVLRRALKETEFKCSTLIHIATLVNRKLNGPSD